MDFPGLVRLRRVSGIIRLVGSVSLTARTGSARRRGLVRAVFTFLSVTCDKGYF
jgi:hypothetical protein